MRSEFEKWISAPPFEHMCDRNGEGSAWPGAYKRYETELAWEAWQAATARCIEIVETHKVPVGNSAAGEMAAEWTMDALREIRDDMRSNAM